MTAPLQRWARCPDPTMRERCVSAGNAECCYGASLIGGDAVDALLARLGTDRLTLVAFSDNDELCSIMTEPVDVAALEQWLVQRRVSVEHEAMPQLVAELRQWRDIGPRLRERYPRLFDALLSFAAERVHEDRRAWPAITEHEQRELTRDARVMDLLTGAER